MSDFNVIITQAPAVTVQFSGQPIPNGAVIPSGGDFGQVLVKLSDDDYDLGWDNKGGYGSAATVAFTAGENIGGHRAIVFGASGMAFYASNVEPSHFGRFAGVTISATEDGASGYAVAYGIITEPTWALTRSMPVYLSSNGLLTQSPPSSGFLQIIGYALTETQIFINQREPISII